MQFITEEDQSEIIRQKAIEAVKLMQQLSIENGTDKITLDEINEIIADTRRKKGIVTPKEFIEKEIN